jgi:hypothetical protein
MRDIHHNILTSQVLSPINSTATRTSNSIDTQGFNSLSMVFSLGLSADALSGSIFWTLTLQHSDDNATFTNCTATECLSGTSTYVINTATADRQTYSIGYLGAKRYVRGVATPTGATTTGMPIAMIALRGDASYAPVLLP